MRDRWVNGVLGNVAGNEARNCLAAELFASAQTRLNCCLHFAEAVCMFRVTTSPTRPMAWESDEINTKRAIES